MTALVGTLADSFLEDLDDLDDDEEETNEQGKLNAIEEGDDDDDEDDDNESDGVMDDDMDLERKLVHLVAAKAASAIGQLRKSNRYKSHITDVRSALQSRSERLIGTLEDDPEYELILSCNKLVHEIDDEIASTHRYITEIYNKKFPELESLIPNKLDYVRTIERIGNEMDMTLVELSDLLPSASVMIVSVTGSTTSGKPLSETDLTECLKACTEVVTLDEDKAIILRFVESRMTRLAPNLSTVIGSRIAAQLVGLAGGIVALSKIPSCNVQVMGQEKRTTLAGFSNAATMPHTGLLYYCDLIQSCPPFVRRKLLKIIAGKVALLARIDSYANAAQREAGAQGAKMRRELEEKIEKLLEPAKAKTKKALPIPEEKKRSKRGGKRVRKLKEKFALTEMRHMQNKISFSTDVGEYGDSAMGVDVGMVGSKDTGRLRAPQKKESHTIKKQKAVAVSSGQTNGLSSSLVFTPVQGLELVNPNAAAERVKAANQKWFSSSSGFMSAAPAGKK